MKENEAKTAIKCVALLHGIPEKDVYEDMRKFITDTYLYIMNSDNHVLKDIWGSIPKSGDIPTPVEYIMYFSNRK